MITPKIENIIVKYMNKSATSADLDLLSKWLKTPTNKQQFKTYVQIHYAINYNLNNPDTSQLKNLLLRKIQKEKLYRFRPKLNPILKYAAILILFLGLAYFYQQGFFNNQPELIIEDEKITLQLENGNIEIIDIEGQSKITDNEGDEVGTQIGDQINYNNNTKELKKLVYNELTIPYGKRFDLVLSDGTKVTLNSGTSIKYPVQFIENENRTVFLKGEAYFDVAKDEAHPFIVNADELNVQVLGTQFNVSSYPEDDFTDVVLVEGSVNLNTIKENTDTEKGTILKPGIKGSFNRKNKDISTKPVITNIYTSWINGELVFRNISFENILKKMERYYNVTIENENSKLAKEKFNASFNNKPIKKILEYFEITYNMHFVIEDNTIIIK